MGAVDKRQQGLSPEERAAAFAQPSVDLSGQLLLPKDKFRQTVLSALTYAAGALQTKVFEVAQGETSLQGSGGYFQKASDGEGRNFISILAKDGTDLDQDALGLGQILMKESDQESFASVEAANDSIKAHLDSGRDFVVLNTADQIIVAVKNAVKEVYQASEWQEQAEELSEKFPHILVETWSDLIKNEEVIQGWEKEVVNLGSQWEGSGEFARLSLQSQLASFHKDPDTRKEKVVVALCRALHFNVSIEDDLWEGLRKVDNLICVQVQKKDLEDNCSQFFSENWDDFLEDKEIIEGFDNDRRDIEEQEACLSSAMHSCIEKSLYDLDQEGGHLNRLSLKRYVGQSFYYGIPLREDHLNRIKNLEASSLRLNTDRKQTSEKGKADDVNSKENKDVFPPRVQEQIEALSSEFPALFPKGWSNVLCNEEVFQKWRDDWDRNYSHRESNEVLFMNKCIGFCLEICENNLSEDKQLKLREYVCIALKFNMPIDDENVQKIRELNSTLEEKQAEE